MGSDQRLLGQSTSWPRSAPRAADSRLWPSDSRVRRMRVPRARGVQVPAAQGAPASSCRGTRTWGQRRDAGAWTSRAEALSFAGRSYLPAVLSCAELADPARSLRHNQRRRDPDAPTRDRRPASTSSPPDVELGRPRRRTGGTGRIGTPKPWCEMLALILVAAVASGRSVSPRAARWQAATTTTGVDATGFGAPLRPTPCHAARTSGSCRWTSSGARRRSPSSGP